MVDRGANVLAFASGFARFFDAGWKSAKLGCRGLSVGASPSWGGADSGASFATMGLGPNAKAGAAGAGAGADLAAAGCGVDVVNVTASADGGDGGNREFPRELPAAVDWFPEEIRGFFVADG
jgi:hypothetical protein